MTELPSFENPPVTEVVFSVQFDALDGFVGARTGHWWSGERLEQYPYCEERPPIPSIREQFGTPRTSEIRFQLTGVPPTAASWFFTADRSELLQIQSDRFTRNWTRQEDRPYPSYDTLRPKFEQDLIEFTEFLEGEGLGPLTVNHAELTYVNLLESTAALPTHGPIARLVQPLRGGTSDNFLGEPETTEMTLRYRIRDGDHEIPARLIVTLRPVFQQSGAGAYILEMTARGEPAVPTVDGTLKFMDIAHDSIVRGFASVTSVDAHTEWKRNP